MRMRLQGVVFIYWIDFANIVLLRLEHKIRISTGRIRRKAWYLCDWCELLQLRMTQ